MYWRIKKGKKNQYTVLHVYIFFRVEFTVRFLASLNLLLGGGRGASSKTNPFRLLKQLKPVEVKQILNIFQSEERVIFSQLGEDLHRCQTTLT